MRYPKGLIKIQIMKKLIFALAIFILAACTKTDKGNSKQTVVAEDPIKFTTNLDTGIYNASDTVPLNITVSSSMPTAGFLYAITCCNCLQCTTPKILFYCKFIC